MKESFGIFIIEKISPMLASVGVNRLDYIRIVRLQSSTIKFKTNQKITHIALTSRYEISASFTRALKKHFEMTPKEFFSGFKKDKKK